MKKLFTIILIVLIYFPAGAQTLKGVISDSSNRQTVPGAIIFIPQLKLQATSDINGNYKIPHIPKGTWQVQVQMLGYATITNQIKIKESDVVKNFILSPSASSEKEVVITALGNLTNTKRSPVPVTLVTHQALLEQASTNVVDAIAREPGVNQITTGPGISKPEINGLGYNRVLTLFDGERQEDFQWGDEHGILIDPYAVYDAEIIRGPASLQYGNYAVAGVVSFKSKPFPYDGTTQGSVLSEYQTNSGMIGNSLDVGGNHHGFVWDLRASEEAAHCYSNPADGYVWGTAWNQENVRLTLGLNRNWGYSRLSFSLLHREAEIPDGNRDSATRQFEFDVPQALASGGNPQYYTAANAPSPSLIGQLIPGTGQVYPTTANYLSYNARLASVYEIMDHVSTWWQNNINAGKGNIEADLGYTQSQRQEIDTGTIPEEGMTVHDLPYSLKYSIAGDSTGLKFTTGINGMYEWNTNSAEPPSPYTGIFEIPNYTDFDAGGYAILQKDWKNLTLSGGLRYDFRYMAGQPMYLAYDNTGSQEIVPASAQGVGPVYTQFPALNRTFNGTSASIGGSYQLPYKNYIKLNFAKSYRAPSILELASNEADPAQMYKQGDPNLKGEQGYEADAGYGFRGADFDFEADCFYNFINNFIFATRIPSLSGGDSLHFGIPVYKFGSSNTAILDGISAYLNIHPKEAAWFELRNGFTLIYSYLPHQTDSTDHIPFTPAPRLTSDVKIMLVRHQHHLFKDTYIEFGLEKDWGQNNIYSALWNELPSLPYVLFNGGIGTKLVNPKNGRVLCSFYINCTNLTNATYMAHTSREQYFWTYNGAYAGKTNYGKTPAVVTNPAEGIYDMGRNIGFKLIIPFGGQNM